jgi:glutaredoxin
VTIKKSPPPQNQTIELFVTGWCPYCKSARRFSQSRGIAFKEYDIEKDTVAAARKNRLDGRRGVPFAIINGYGIHGFSEAAYARALQQTP